eukprot:2219110-Pyramimonas_sp.AAC.1
MSRRGSTGDQNAEGGHYLAHHQNKSSPDLGKRPQAHYLSHHLQKSSSGPSDKGQAPKLRDAVRVARCNEAFSSAAKLSPAARHPQPSRTPSQSPG